MLLSFGLSLLTLVKLCVLLEAPRVSNQNDIHYSIQDILERYKNFTDIKREISLYQEHPEYDTSCIKDALFSILPQCLKKSISELDPKLRSKTAAKLSICEFQVAEIDYPEECHIAYLNSIGDYSDCVISMERKAQWWTSYSGYYRTIGEICYYEKLPYEKDIILDVFMNVTEHYERILVFLNDYVEMTEVFKKESNGSFNELIKFMNETINITKLNKETNDFIWDFIKTQLNKISEISTNVTDITLTQTNSIERNLIKFLNNVDKEYSESLSSLKDEFINDLEERDALIMRIFNDTRLNLLSLNDELIENNWISTNISNNLRIGIKNSKILNNSIITLDLNINDLNYNVTNVKNLINDVNDILNNNPFIRALIYTTSQLYSLNFEMIMFFASFTSLLFFCLYCLNFNFFKLIGIGIISIISSLSIMFLCCSINSHDTNINTDLLI